MSLRSFRSSSLSVFSLAFAGALVAAGCASSDGSDPAPGEGRPESMDEDLRTCTSSPREYFATLRAGQSCGEIPGRRGAWVPEALFEDAPLDVSANMCRYVWRGEKYSRGDQDAIRAKFPMLEMGQALTPACGSSLKPKIGDLQQIPSLSITGHVGASGCDVCGKLRDRKIWVLIPPERLTSREFAVQLSNGESRYFQIQDAGGARALSITLPPAPRGTSYVPGTVAIY
jgi:hypothetical protein